MHATARFAAKPCPRAGARVRITPRPGPVPVTVRVQPAAKPARGTPDLDDPRMRALPIAVLALAFALAGDIRPIR